jgi:hypothetical protein
MADSHGNTALQYLAGSWYLNESLVAELRAWTTGEFAWQTYSNLWGHTPKDLMDENLAVRSDVVKDNGLTKRFLSISSISWRIYSGLVCISSTSSETKLSWLRAFWSSTVASNVCGDVNSG